MMSAIKVGKYKSDIDWAKTRIKTAKTAHL